MGRGKRWTREELGLLKEMIQKGMDIDKIVQSGKFKERTHEAIRVQVNRQAFVGQTKKPIVEQIRPVEVISLDEVLKRFTDAFRQICESTELDRTELNRFRIIFSAAKEYAPLLTQYERLKTVEEEIAELKRILDEVKAQINEHPDPDKRRNPEAPRPEEQGNQQPNAC